MRLAGLILGLMAVFVIAVITIFYMRAVSHDSASDYLEDRKEATPVGAKSEESAQIARLTKEVAELKEELAVARAEGVVDPGAKGEEKGKGKKGEGMMKTFAKMMEDPTMRDAIRGQQRIAVKGMFADFFRELGLSEEEEAAVTDLFLEKQMANMEVGMGMMNKDLSKAERDAMAKEIKDTGDEVDTRIKEALGEENFENYKLFIDSQQERQQLSVFKEGLKGQGLDLSYEAEGTLMDAMYETRKGFKFSMDFGTDAEPNPEVWAGMTKERADRMMEETRKLHEEIAGKAAKILSPEQLEYFRASQESQLKMQEMGMKMTLQMGE